MRCAVNTKVKKINWDPVLLERATETEAERQRAERQGNERHRQAQRRAETDRHGAENTETARERDTEVRKRERLKKVRGTAKDTKAERNAGKTQRG